MAHKCRVCKEKATSFLRFQKKLFWKISFDVSSRVLCDEHLIEEFSSAFIKYPSKMIVFPPYLPDYVQEIPVNLRVPYSYEYYPMIMAPKNIKNALRSISGRCQKCSQNANAAVYDKKYIEREEQWPEIGGIDSAVPQIVCNVCAIALIAPDINEFVGEFHNGLCTPYGGDGYYMVADW